MTDGHFSAIRLEDYKELRLIDIFPDMLWEISFFPCEKRPEFYNCPCDDKTHFRSICETNVYFHFRYDPSTKRWDSVNADYGSAYDPDLFGYFILIARKNFIYYLTAIPKDPTKPPLYFSI